MVWSERSLVQIDRRGSQLRSGRVFLSFPWVVVLGLLIQINGAAMWAQRVGSTGVVPKAGTSNVSSVELFGTVTASQVANGLGFVIPQDNLDIEFAAAAAAGATHVRFQCSWKQVEQQTAPPNNAPATPQYVQDPNCVSGFASVKKYGLKPTVVAAFGPPFHTIVTVTIPNGASVGTTSILVQFASGVGGDTVANLAFPYDYILGSDGTFFTGAHNTAGSFISSVTPVDSGRALLELSSAVTVALPASTAKTYNINEILYPSATTAKASDASQVEYGNYVSFLASDMASRGISGEIEIWNEPPWADDSWDARGYLYDRFPAGQTTSPNYGFAANLQNRSMPAGVTLNWGGTHKSGGNSLLFGPYQPLPMTLREPSNVFASESFHPYGNTPEQMMWLSACLLGTIATPSSPSAYQGCSLLGEKTGSNFMWAVQYNRAIRALKSNYGLVDSITETGMLPPVAGLRAAQARFNMRQFIGYQALGITPVDFYSIADASQNSDPNYAFVTLNCGDNPCPDNPYTSSSSISGYSPTSAYSAIAGFMAELKPISNLPVSPYSAATLPQVMSYGGTYPLSTAHLVGARSGAKANSDMFVMWQRSYTPGCAAAGNTNAASCDNPWAEMPSPSSGSVMVAIPTGYRVSSVVNLDTEANVAYTTAGQQITLPVADDPIAILVDPVPAPITTTLELSTNPTQSNYGLQVVITAVLSPYVSGADATSGEDISFFDGEASLGTATLSSGIATLNVTSLGLGNHTLTAKYGGDGVFAGSTGTASITVGGAPPVITFAPIQSQVFGVPSFAVSASSNSPGAITYGVVSGPAKISGDVVTLTGAGTVVLEAEQVAAGNYAAATVQTSFAVTVATTVADDFSLVPNGTTTATIGDSGSATYALTVVSLFNASGTVVLNCANVPSDLTCKISPSSVSLGGNTPVTVIISPLITSAAMSKTPNRNMSNLNSVMLAAVPMILLGLRRRMRPLLLAAGKPLFRTFTLTGMMLASVSILGCGGTVVVALNGNAQPTPGTYKITVNGTMNQAVRTVQLTVTVK
jgi:hypothetical protein